MIVSSKTTPRGTREEGAGREDPVFGYICLTVCPKLKQYLINIYEKKKIMYILFLFIESGKSLSFFGLKFN